MRFVLTTLVRHHFSTETKLDILKPSAFSAGMRGEHIGAFRADIPPSW